MKLFSNKYYNHYSGNKFREVLRNKFKLTPKVSILFKFIEQLPEKSKALDVGCGTGGMLELIENENPLISTIGVDIGHPPNFQAKSIFLHANTTKLPFPDNSFELVTCQHVIEHILYPFDAISEIVRVCKPGGIVYIEAPSHRAALFPFSFNFWDDPTHVRPYSSTALERLLSESNLEIIKKGVKKSLIAVILGLPYLAIGTITGDKQAKNMFLIYLFGLNVFAIGKKPTRQPAKD